MGEGYIKKADVDPDLKLLTHHYTLKQDFYLKRLAPKESGNLISIVFNSTEIPTDGDKRSVCSSFKKNGSAIHISSSALGTETFFPANSEIYFTVLGVKPQSLAAMLRIEKTNSIVETILSGKTNFFFHEQMTPEFKRILKQLDEINQQDKLSHLYYKIKIQELLYLLFSKLLNRETEKHNPINKADIDKIYKIRTAIITDLSVPPSLHELATSAGMSETKMKQLFKQTFGDSIYNYYQKARMSEASFLLKQAAYSVTEVGYQLGFSNLSHFSRLFEKHYGLTPKKFTSAG
ncbi:MAG: transcriptional regulator, AraC family [Bacteroidetes bacterium]|nr:transcriptional regulator, AraC family [Bacteroidota bacterium]